MRRTAIPAEPAMELCLVFIWFCIIAALIEILACSYIAFRPEKIKKKHYYLANIF
jgi:hypothetical protein